MPMPARPPVLRRCLAFNHVIGLGLIFARLGNVEVACLNVVCQGTSFEMVIRIDGRVAEEVAAEFARVWATRYGWPCLVIMDQDSEFVGVP